MNIFIIGRFYEEGFALFIAEELERMGHTVRRYDPGPTLSDYSSRLGVYLNKIKLNAHSLAQNAARILGRESNRKLFDAVTGALRPDVILCCHDFLMPKTAVELKRLTSAQLVLWYPDPIWSFGGHRFLNAPFDVLFFKDPYLVDVLSRSIEAPAYYLPECYSPYSLKPPVLTSEELAIYGCDLATAGNIYPYRIALFSKLKEHKVKLWGLPPPRWAITADIDAMLQGRFVAHSTKAKAFRGAKIVVNNLNPAEIWGTNVRTFEIAGAGAFQLVDWRPGLGQLFRDGEEVVSFRSLADLKDKIRHYLSDPGEREAIAAAGHRRAIAEHTYRHRLDRLLATLSGHEKGYPRPRISQHVVD